MRVPELNVIGECSSCKQSVGTKRSGLGAGAALPHKCEGKPCKGSGYGVWNHKFVIETPEEAQTVAQFLAEDRGACLMGTERHTGMCGDGRTCHETRRLLASALATCYLTLFHDEKVERVT